MQKPERLEEIRKYKKVCGCVSKRAEEKKAKIEESNTQV